MNFRTVYKISGNSGPCPGLSIKNIQKTKVVWFLLEYTAYVQNESSVCYAWSLTINTNIEKAKLKLMVLHQNQLGTL